MNTAGGAPEWPYGDVFINRCSDTECDGAHIHIRIGKLGERPLGHHVTDAAGARSLAAELCRHAGEIEAAGLAVKPS